MEMKSFYFYRKPHERILSALLTLMIAVSFAGGCVTRASTRYTYETMRAFGTVITLIGYAHSQDEFDRYASAAEDIFVRLHREFDVFNGYEGITNLKSVNDAAGQTALTVSQDIIDLLVFSKRIYYETKGKVNIALGAVLRQWHAEMVRAVKDPLAAAVPSADKLREASLYANIEDLVIDEVNKTVFIRNPQMSLDVGALAKGFAVEKAALALQKMGVQSFLISAGGSNLKLIGAPIEKGRTRWAIGIQDPDADLLREEREVLDTVYLSDTSFVTSGDYQRFYFVGEDKYHHIIDPVSLYPAEHYRAVIVVYPDSALADAFSTALFIMNLNEGKQLIAKYPGLEVAWILDDGEIKGTDGLIQSMKIRGTGGG